MHWLTLTAVAATSASHADPIAPAALGLAIILLAASSAATWQLGMRTDLGSFVQPGVLGLAAVLTVAAVLGKQLSALGVLGRKMDWLTVASA